MTEGKKRVVEYSESEEDFSEDDEVLPPPKKRGAPKARYVHRVKGGKTGQILMDLPIYLYSKI